jgi:hypothetical protein
MEKQGFDDGDPREGDAAPDKSLGKGKPARGAVNLVESRKPLALSR